MCYKLPGPRCTNQAREKSAHSKADAAAYLAAHPKAKFDEDASPGSISGIYTRKLLRCTRYHSDMECSPGNRRWLAAKGTELKREIMDAKIAGDENIEDIQQMELILRDMYSRWHDASRRDREAKAEENVRRRQRWAARKTQQTDSIGA